MSHPVDHLGCFERVQRVHELTQQNEHLQTKNDALQKRVNELEAISGKRHAPVRYAVIRFSPDYPKEYIPQDLDGRWFDLEEMDNFFLPIDDDEKVAVARAIDFYQARDDGRVGQVFEISLRLKDFIS